MKTVVVLGGGIGGATSAYALRKSGRVTVVLVDPKEYFELPYAQLRGLVDPEGIGRASRIPYPEIFGSAFVQGRATLVEEKAVILKGGKRLAFDYLILAPGTRYPRFPLAKPLDQTSLRDREAFVRTEHNRFLAASSFLVAGGGVVGVELAGELASAAPGKMVRLAHKGSRLAANLSERASAMALRQLKQAGVEVQLNSTDAVPGPGEILYETFSPEPATGFLAGVPGILDTKGIILVDAFLKVKGHPDWFAVGDVSGVAEPRHGSFTAQQATYVARQILNAVADRPKSWKPYPLHPSMAMVPIGAVQGFTDLPFGVVTWKFLIDMKRKDFFTTRTRKGFGLSAT